MTRIELADKILPCCEPLAVALKSETHFGWIYDAPQIRDAVARWRAGTLAGGHYSCVNKEGVSYTVDAPQRMGVVPHRDGLVRMFAPDLDNHEGGTDTTIYDAALSRFFGAEPVRFSSKSGRGIRQVYMLKEPMPVDEFLATIRSHGFSRTNRIEVFPKTEKLSQFWLPNDPNDNGGDRYISGSWDGAVATLPEALPCALTNAALDFVLGFVGNGQVGHNAVFSASCEMGEKRVDVNVARALIYRAAAINGKDDSREIGKAFTDGYAKGAAKTPAPIAIAKKTTGDANAIRSELWKISQTKGMSSTEKHRATSSAVLGWLHARGRFYHTEEQTFAGVMFFDAQRKLLLPVQGDAFLGWLSDVLALNRSERPFDFVKSACETEGLSERSTTITPAAFWAAREGAVYLSSGPGRMVRVSAGQVAAVDNGTDGILFPVGATLDPWTLTEPLDPFEACALFRDMTTAAAHGRVLFELWAMSLSTDQRTKPPCCVSGGVGAGKTRLVRGVFELYGLPARIGAVTRNGEMDFWAAIDGGGLTCFDNADTRVEWFPDALAAAATAGTLEKRKLYTDSTRVSLKARAWLCVTSANPSFAADAGLADRLIVVRLNRRTGTTAESALTDEILAHRDSGLSWITQKLAVALADREPVPEGLNARHPDFAALAVRVGRAIGRGDQAVAALRAAESDKSLFNIENDTIGAALLQVMQGDVFAGTVAELLPRVIEADATLAGRISAKSLSRRLAKLWPHLESVFRATKDVRHGGGMWYTFRKTGDSGDLQSLFSEKSPREENNGTLPVWRSISHQSHHEADDWS